jgi:hypothetical protein
VQSTPHHYYSGFHLGMDKAKTTNKKYGFYGLQVVKDSLQTAMCCYVIALQFT